MPGLCSACLCDDRNCTPVNTFKDASIFMNWFDTPITDELEICWECHAMFLKINKFRNQVFEAQKIIKSHFRSKKSRNIKLSTLSTHTKNYYDRIYVKSEKENIYSSSDLSNNKVCVNQDLENNIMDLNIWSKDSNTENADTSLSSTGPNMCFTNDLDKNICSHSTNIVNEENIISVVRDSIKEGTINFEATELPTPEIGSHFNRMKGIKNISPNTYNKKKKNECNKFRRCHSEKKFIVFRLCEKEMLEARERDRNIARYKISTYKCEKCVLGYFHEEKYEKHVKDKHNEEAGPYICSICEIRFTKVEYLKYHHNCHFRSYECKLCGYQHHRIKTMEAHHVKSHERETKYVCKICHMVFDVKCQLRYHYNVLHKELPKCNLCDKTYKSNYNLKEHISTHIKPVQSYTCSVCSHRYKSKAGLRTHMRSAHEAPDEAAYCAECDIQFKAKLTYKRHLLESRKHCQPDMMKYVCDHCDTKFSNKSNLKQHIARKHVRWWDITCDRCQKSFAERSSLNKHILEKHEGVAKPRDKICSYCGKGFYNRHSLNLHIRTHTGEKPYQCEYCDSSFAQKSTLKTHVKAKHRNVES